MSIKKFMEKYPYLGVKKEFLKSFYTVYKEDEDSIILLCDLDVEREEYFFHMGMYGKWEVGLINDIRYLYKYLRKEHCNRLALKRKKENGRTIKES